MQASASLSLAIPTYNREVFLEASLAEHTEMAAEAGVSIIISDNASIDRTQRVVESFREATSNILYFRNEYTILPDENFEKVLGYPDSKYVWLLGDTYLIPKQTFRAVLDAIEEEEYDVIILNVEERVKDVSDKVYVDRNELLSELGWHMTCMSSLVYSRHLLQEADYKRYRDTNFLQTGIIFEFLADRPVKVKWISVYSVMGLKVPGVIKKSWEDQTFEIWTKRWANFVFSLPKSYTLDSKLKCVMDHGKKARLFRSSDLKRLRFKGILNPQSYQQYVRYFPFTIDASRHFIKLLAFLPRKLVKYL
jgi:glycosyltransferase involved in cell wall biosynthesis